VSAHFQDKSREVYSSDSDRLPTFPTPRGAAWLIKIKLSDPSEAAKLMNTAAYEAFIAEKQKEVSA